MVLLRQDLPALSSSALSPTLLTSLRLFLFASSCPLLCTLLPSPFSLICHLGMDKMGWMDGRVVWGFCHILLHYASQTLARSLHSPIS